MRFTALALLLALGMAAHGAPTLSFTPANPTPADTIVLTIRDSSPTCPYVVPTSTRFATPNEIRIVISHIGDCGFGPYSETRTTLGRLPAGTYSVVVADSTGRLPPADVEVASKELTVSLPAGAGGTTAAAPLENYAGHYLTGQDGEGVFIEHFGDKSFLTFATYDSDGRPAWFVMPDARWRYNASRSRFEFAGSMYRTRRGPESPPSITVVPVGTGVWYSTGFDTAVLETMIDGAATRSLRRFRF